MNSLRNLAFEGDQASGLVQSAVLGPFHNQVDNPLEGSCFTRDSRKDEGWLSFLEVRSLGCSVTKALKPS